MKKNNIELIESFLSSTKYKTLLINEVSDEIYSFYNFVIKEFADKLDIKVINNINPDDIKNSNELFVNRKVNIFSLNNTKRIEEVAGREFQKIIFTDYKNYKKLLGKYQIINGYDFEKDLKIFFKNYNDIQNGELINYCLSHPYLTLSELSKYKVNSSNYSTYPIKSDTHNFILQIRKEIFMSKKTSVNIKELFNKLKNEVKYKKFSFLTY
jgi:hypothetical protein